MALALDVSNLTVITLATSIGNWTRTHTVAQASAITDSDFFRQGTESVAWQTKSTGANQGMAYDSGASNIDLSGTILRMWAQFNEANKYNTKVNGGVRVFVSDGAQGADNWGEWYVDGSDTLTADWRNYVIDTTTPFDRTSATAPTMTTIRRVGISTNMVTKPAKVQNCHVDAIRYGNQIIVTGSVAETGNGWAEVAAIDENVSNQYGLFQRDSSTGVFKPTGEIIIGDAAGTLTTDFSDNKNSKLIFPAPTTGNLDGSYKITIQGNATGTTDFQLGDVVGTGDDRQGVLGGTISTQGDSWEFDSETDTADIDSANLYGVTFEGAGNIKLSGATTQELIGGALLNCDEFQPNNAENLNYSVIAPSPDRGLEYTTTGTGKQITFIAGATADQPVEKVWQVDVSATPDAFVPYADEANDATANDVICFPATEASGDYFAFGYPGKFAKARINTGTARSGGTLVLEYKTAAGWSTLTATDGTNTLSTTGLQDITFTPPTDWVAASIAVDTGINAEIPQFYIRFRVTATMTTNPLVTQMFIGDLVEHHVHHPAADTVTYEALNFFGFGASGAPKWHGENSSAGTVTINPTEDANPVEAEFDNTGAGSTTVNQPSVTTTIKILDGRDNSNLQNARVILKASDGTGDLPYLDSVTITRSGTTATVSHTAHGLATGNKVEIKGITDKTEDNNGTHTITVTGANAYTYTTTNSGSTSYTGSITSTGVVLEGLTDVNGEISDTRAWTLAQPVTGVARKATTSPIFRDSNDLIGTISTTAGLSITQALTFDE